MRILKTLTLALAASFAATLVIAAEPGGPAWHTDVGTAWRAAQNERRPLLVFVTRDNCFFCVKMKRGTLVDPRVAAAIHAGYVPLMVDATQPSPLTKELAVSAFPTTFVISPDAIVLDRIDGYVAPDALSTRLAMRDRTARP
jgi:protein disulfide-isomerase